MSEKPLKAKYEYTNYELILTTYVFSEVAQIKSIFDSEDIIYFIQGEDLGVAPGGVAGQGAG